MLCELKQCFSEGSMSAVQGQASGKGYLQRERVGERVGQLGGEPLNGE